MSDIWKELTQKEFTYTKLQELELKALRITLLSCLAKKSYKLADTVVAEANTILNTETNLSSYSETWTQLENQLKAQKKQADEKEKKVWEAAFKKRQSSSVSMYADEEIDKKEKETVFNSPDLNKPPLTATTNQDMNEILTQFMQNSSNFSKGIVQESKKSKKSNSIKNDEEEIVHSTSWYPFAALGFAAVSIGAYFYIRNKN